MGGGLIRLVLSSALVDSRIPITCQSQDVLCICYKRACACACLGLMSLINTLRRPAVWCVNETGPLESAVRTLILMFSSLTCFFHSISHFSPASHCISVCSFLRSLPHPHARHFSLRTPSLSLSLALSHTLCCPSFCCPFSVAALLYSQKRHFREPGFLLEREALFILSGCPDMPENAENGSHFLC